MKQVGERLKSKLEEEDLSPSRFSEILGINRSGISHILNNRNKPGFDFLAKVRSNFPDWNIEWLMFGEGEPHRKPADKPQTTNHGRFSENRSVNTTSENEYSRSLMAELKEMKSELHELKKQQKEVSRSSMEQPERKEQKSQPQFHQASLFDSEQNESRTNHDVRVQKKVLKTILIYSDGTFDIFSNNLK